MDKILKRIKKLLALANDVGASEGEATNAMERVHALLSEHNLTLADAEGVSLDSKQPIGEHHYYDTSRDRTAVWKANTFVSVCRLYYCDALCQDTYDRATLKPARRWYILGTEDNVAVAKVVAAFVIDQMRNIAGEACKGASRSYKDSFLKGMSLRVHHRVLERIAAAKRGEVKGSTGTALIHLDSAYNAVEKYSEDWISKRGVRSAPRTSVSDMAGMQAGRAAGDRVSLNAPLTTATAPALR